MEQNTHSTNKSDGGEEEREGEWGQTDREPELKTSNTILEDIPLVEFIHLVFTGMPGESYRRLLRFLLLGQCLTSFER